MTGKLVYSIKKSVKNTKKPVGFKQQASIL